MVDTLPRKIRFLNSFLLNIIEIHTLIKLQIQFCFLVDFLKESCYNQVMKHILFEYFSNNGIDLHHFLYTPTAKSPDIEEVRMIDRYKVILQLRGTALHLIDGIPYTVSPMSLCIFPINAIHSIEIIPPEPCESITLHLTPSLLPKFQSRDIFSCLNLAAEYNYIIPAQFVKSYQIKEIFDIFLDNCKKHDNYTELELVIHFLRLIERISKIVNDPLFNAPIKEPSLKQQSFCYLAMQYIKNHITEKITATDVAKELHVSSSYLCHIFKKELGLTLHNYIFKKRMLYAFELLSHGEPPVSVANQLGYEYYSTFYHHYMKHFHCSPKNVFTHVNKQRIFTNLSNNPK